MSEPRFMGHGYYAGMEESYCKRIDELMAERDRLKAKGESLCQQNGNLLVEIHDWKSRAEKAEAMAERLAEALKELSSIKIECDFDKAKEVLKAYEQAKGESHG